MFDTQGHDDMLSREIVGKLAREVLEDYRKKLLPEDRAKYEQRKTGVLRLCDRMGVTVAPSVGGENVH